MDVRNALQRAREFISAQGGEVAPLSLSEEELNPELQDDLTLQVVQLESMDSTYQVSYSYPDDSDCSEFRFFEDGKQRTVQIGHIPSQIGNNRILIPVHFYVVGAVILERVDKKLELWHEPEICQGIFVERSFVPDQSVLNEFERMGLVVTDTAAPQGADYYDLRRRALQEAKKLRLNLEDTLIARLRQSSVKNEGFLIVDGTLMNFRNEDNVERCVGISKSFGSRYFNLSDHNRIMQMAEFERSWAFRFHSPDDEADDARMGARERISWYLRLRSRSNTDPEFGLIRVEISRRHAEQVTKYADRLSRSILSERLPTSYPAPRWDKHLYPIRACENYLSSVMPSISTITASMKGVGL